MAHRPDLSPTGREPLGSRGRDKDLGLPLGEDSLPEPARISLQHLAFELSS